MLFDTIYAITRSERINMSGLLTLVAVSMVTAGSGTHYGFFREMGGGDVDAGGGGSRRVFGGEATELASFPSACALLDRYWATRCSCAVVAPRWALTAAHCVSPWLAYVKYNARRPGSLEGDVAPVHYLYKHPEYEVVQEDRGRGLDVTTLHHDVGLVRTRTDMALATALQLDPLAAMTFYDPRDLTNEEIRVLGFGRTERSPLGEELFSVVVRAVPCERGSWYYCVCGSSRGVGGEGGGARGVCSGDSGGPVVYRGAQVALTSMGPMECATRGSAPPESATSVFTSLHRYARLLNATIHDTESELRMNRISSARTFLSPQSPQSLLLALLLLGTLAV